MSRAATPSRKLSKLWHEWIDLHAELKKCEHKGTQTPATPFFSAASNKKCGSPILFVGKATRASWYPAAYRRELEKSADEAIRERLNLNRDFVRKGRGAFWNFFGRLAEINQEFGSDGVIWTNVAKIGSEIGNPRGWLLSKQADLAERTLRTEIEEYRPKISIFVTGTNKVSDGIIGHALGVSDCDWKKSEKIDRKARVPDVWWTEHPPIAIWTRHPQGASSRETGYWIQKIRELTRSEA